MNTQFDIGTTTKAFLDVVDKQLGEENELLDSGINAFIERVFSQETKVFHTPVNRLEELVKQQLGDFKNADERNSLIRSAIVQNVLAFQLEEKGERFDSESYNTDELYRKKINIRADKTTMKIGTENTSGLDFMIRKDREPALLLRKHVFATAFVLDLTIDELTRYMMHTLGQSDFNFRDPYEVIIVFTFTWGREKYATYRKLCEMYELEYSRLEEEEKLKINTNATTSNFKAELSRLLPDLENPDITEKSVVDPLIHFLCKLPRENKKASGRVMKDLCKSLSFVEKGFMQSDIFKYLDNKTVFIQSIKIEKKGEFEDIKTKARFPHDKKLLNTESREKEMKKIDFSAEVFSKENILTMLFYEFVTTGKRDTVWATYLHQGTELQPSNVLRKIRDAFAAFSLEPLNKAGYDQLYVVNKYECFLLYCLMTRDPIQTFSEVVSVPKKEKGGKNEN